MKYLLLTVLLCLLSTQAFSCSMDGQSGFMPQNDMKIGTEDGFRNSMTEVQFNEIISKVEKVYAPIIENKKGWGFLKISRNWESTTVNAFAMRIGPLHQVNMYGGLARHPDVTDDAFTLVVCHEIGHHIGGSPKNYFPMSWSSVEGQSDYFATLKCFRKITKGDNNIEIVAMMEVDPGATAACEASWSNASDIALCQRSAMAGKSLAKLLAGSGKVPEFETPDPSVVKITFKMHPKGQCRLDTYFQGALCTQPDSIDLHKRDPNKGTCNRAANDTVGLRPLCWFKPKK